ncbi:hypothetical protein LOK49_LG07G00335 [Camellia lanceoleosa]|uniref:Uncharacterized protein n=1 Tax=Camellia lanceoleosa TaxID=1840588 RepID=A0ACC0GYI4_9ERIC|nr:hypothetical protein LOK49_LG07G00335 [Camellia lanceoleosa]
MSHPWPLATEEKPVEKKPTEEKKSIVAKKAPVEKKPKAGKKLPKESGAAAGDKKKKRSKKSIETYKMVGRGPIEVGFRRDPVRERIRVYEI